MKRQWCLNMILRLWTTQWRGSAFTLTVLRSFLNCFKPYPRDTLGENSCIWCMFATTLTAVRRPTPLHPANKSEPPGCVRTRSTRAMLSRTSRNIRMSSSRFSRPEDYTKFLYLNHDGKDLLCHVDQLSIVTKTLLFIKFSLRLDDE